MKAIIVIVVAGIAVFLLYKWANPPPSPYAGLPSEFRRMIEKSEEQVDKDVNSEFGRGAEAVCRHRLGIKEQVRTGVDVVNLGYGSDKAIAFVQCIADTMYPVPK